MPRKASSIPKKQRVLRNAGAFEADTPRMMSDEEKHRMIMAHAAARAPQDPLQRVSLWAGVTLSVAALAVGWWFTVGTGIQQNVGQGSEQLRQAAAELDKFTNLVQTSPALNNPANSPTSAADAATFGNVMRDNLFKPADDSTADANATSTPTDQKSPPSAPSVPAGLTPDP